MRSPRSFTTFLARSLALLEDEMPSAYSAVASHLGGREVLLHVDEETLSVRGAGERLHLSFVGTAPVVELRTCRDVIAALIEGEITLLDAVLSERLVLVGSVDDLVAFDAGLIAYLNGAVRCPAFPNLRDDYLSGVKPTPMNRSEGAPEAPGAHHAQ